MARVPALYEANRGKIICISGEELLMPRRRKKS